MQARNVHNLICTGFERDKLLFKMLTTCFEIGELNGIISKDHESYIVKTEEEFEKQCVLIKELMSKNPKEFDTRACVWLAYRAAVIINTLSEHTNVYIRLLFGCFKTDFRKHIGTEYDVWKVRGLVLVHEMTEQILHDHYNVW